MLSTVRRRCCRALISLAGTRVYTRASHFRVLCCSLTSRRMKTDTTFAICFNFIVENSSRRGTGRSLNGGPDETGLRHAVRFLQGGGSKFRFLGGLRYSPEGREKGVRVEGLWWRYVLERIFRVPFLGYILESLVALVRMPAAVRHHRALEFYTAGQVTKVAEFGVLTAGMVRKDLSALRALSMGAALDRQAAGMAKLGGEIDWIMGADAREAAKSRELDSFYVALEERFRGSRSEIKARVAGYLPILAEAAVASKESPLLDIGCGRGEWLEVLRDNGISARGLDLNSISVADCLERGLDAINADAMSFLKSQFDGSLGAITSMHLVEHLPLSSALRAVGGMPQNAQVAGALDPRNAQSEQCSGRKQYLLPRSHTPQTYPVSPASLCGRVCGI